MKKHVAITLACLLAGTACSSEDAVAPDAVAREYLAARTKGDVAASQKLSVSQANAEDASQALKDCTLTLGPERVLNDNARSYEVTGVCPENRKENLLLVLIRSDEEAKASWKITSLERRTVQ